MKLDSLWKSTSFTLRLTALSLLLACGCGPSWREQLLRSGTASRAVITSIAETGWWINRQPQCEIGLRVEPKAGAPFHATTKRVVPMTQLAQLQPGRVVTVRYDQANPNRVVIEMLGHNALDEVEAKRMIAASSSLEDALNAPGAAVTAAGAIVITFTPTGWTVNGDNPLATLRIKVLPPGGPPFDGTLVGSFVPSGLHKYQPGSEIHVLFDSVNPTRVAFDRRLTTTILSSPPSGAP